MNIKYISSFCNAASRDASASKIHSRCKNKRNNQSLALSQKLVDQHDEYRAQLSVHRAHFFVHFLILSAVNYLPHVTTNIL